MDAYRLANKGSLRCDCIASAVCAILLSLVHVVAAADSQRTITLEYDGAGNLVRRTVSSVVGPPVIGTLMPAFIHRDSVVAAVVEGVGLLGVSVSPQSSGLSISAIDNSSDGTLRFELTATDGASIGPATLVVGNAVGSTSVDVLVAERLPIISTDPNPIGLPPDGIARTVKLRFAQPFATAQSFDLSIREPTIASAGETNVVLAAGSTEATLTLAGLTEGTTTLDITQAENFFALGALVIVSNARPPPGALVVAAPPLGVSAYLPPSAVVNATTYPAPLGVSAYLQPNAVISATTYPPPLGVGVYLQPSVAVSATTYPAPLGAAFGTSIAGVSPSTLSSPSTVDLIVTGDRLDAVTDVGFDPADGVTLIAPGGRSINYLPDPNAAPDGFLSPDNDFAIFVRNPNGSYLHTEKDGIEMHFDVEGRITAHEDRNGNTTAYTYDGLDRLETITDPVGRVTDFAYGADGKLATVTDPAERVSQFDFDLDGNLVKLTYPDGTSERYEYDERHLMTAHTDELGNRSTDRYDAFGRVIDGTLPDGTVRAAASQDMVGVVDVSSGLGTIDNPASITRPEAARGEYVDGRGNPSVTELDPHGRATMTVDEVGRTTDHQRDADSNPTRTTRPIGSVVVRTFDDHANVLTEREEFNGATTTYTYDPFSLVTSVQNPNGHQTVINRDSQGNPVEIINHLGHTTTLEYDNRGLVTRKVSPNQLETSYTYGANGLLATQAETPPAGSPGNVRITQYSYHSTGLLAQVTTPDLIVLDYLYDERNALVTVTDNLNQSIVYSYDSHKNVIATETHSADGSLAILIQSVYRQSQPSARDPRPSSRARGLRNHPTPR